MTATGTQETAKTTRTLVLRAPARAYVVGAALGAGGALLPYITSGILVPWVATPGTLVAGALVALAAHGLLHVLVARPEGRARPFVAATLAPGASVALAAALAFGLVPALRASAYAALVANAAASAADVWEAVAVLALAPALVREREDGAIECDVDGTRAAGSES